MDIPWGFLFSTLLFGIILIYFIFYSSNVLALVVTKLLAAFVLPNETFIRIGSLHMGILGGRILFRGVTYATKNTSLRIVDGDVTIRWWKSKVRQGISTNEEFPCRMEVHLNGVEYLIYNNTYKYDELEVLLSKRNGTSIEVDKEVLESVMDSAVNHEPSVFYRLFPAIGIELRKGCVYVGNPYLPHMFVLTLAKASGVYSMEKATFPMLDYAQEDAFMEVQNISGKIVPNPDYNARGEELKTTKKVTLQEDFVQYAHDTFKSLYQDIRFAFTNPDEKHHQSSFLKRNKNGTWKGLSRYNDPNFGKEQAVFRCPSLRFTYRRDVQGPVPASDTGNGVFDSKVAPLWNLDVNCQDASITYGPWINEQRNLIQRFFYPMDYNSRTMHVPVVGRKREYACFTLTCTFTGNTCITIPFMHALESESKGDRAWFKLKTGTCRVFYSLPWVVTSEHGIDAVVEIESQDCNVVSSLTPEEIPLFTCSLLQMNMLLNYPNVWNSLNQWKLNFHLENAKLFLLYQYVLMTKDLIRDWISTSNVDLVHFIPTKYTIKSNFSNFELYLNVNEKNIAKKPNSIPDNAHFVLGGPSLEMELTLPFQHFQTSMTEIPFSFKVKQPSLRLQLPSHHTVFIHHEQMRNHNGHVCQADNLEISGSYSYHGHVDPKFTDCVRLTIATKNLVAILLGFFIRYLLFFKDNYFGNHTRISLENPSQHATPKNVHEEPSDQQAASNDLEVYILVTFENNTIHLPTGLYTMQEKEVVTIRQFVIECRYLPTYFDVYLNLNPIVLQLPSLKTKEEDPIASLHRLKHTHQGNCLTVTDLSFRLRFLYGPRPSRLTYCTTFRITVGHVIGHTLFVQLLHLGNWLQSFAYHFQDQDNAFPVEPQPKYPAYKAIKLKMPALHISIWENESVTNIDMPYGARMKTDSLAHKFYHRKSTIEIPKCTITQLVQEDVFAAETKRWTEVGNAIVALNVSIYARDPQGISEYDSNQRSFLQEQDKEQKQLLFLWDDLELQEAADYNQDILPTSVESTSDAEDSPVLSPLSLKSNSTATAEVSIEDKEELLSTEHSAESLTPEEHEPRSRTSSIGSESGAFFTADAVSENTGSYATPESSIAESLSSDDEEVENMVDESNIYTEELGTVPSMRIYVLDAEPQMKYGSSASYPMFVEAKMGKRVVNFGNTKEPESKVPSEATSSFKSIYGRLGGVYKSSSILSRRKDRRKHEQWLTEEALLNSGKDDYETTTFVVDCMNVISITLTPLAVNNLARLFHAYAKLTLSPGYVLDIFQLKSLSSFASDVYPFRRQQICIAISAIEIKLLNEAGDAHDANRNEHYTRMTLRDFLFVSAKRNVGESHTFVSASQPQNSKLLDAEGSVSFSSLRVDYCSLSDKLDNTTKERPVTSINVSATIENFTLTAKFDGFQALNDEHSKGSFAVLATIEDVRCLVRVDCPAVIVEFTRPWARATHELKEAISAARELRKSRLWITVLQLLSVTLDEHSKSLFLDPTLEQLVGKQAMLHRLKWKDISQLRMAFDALADEKKLLLLQALKQPSSDSLEVSIQQHMKLSHFDTEAQQILDFESDNTGSSTNWEVDYQWKIQSTYCGVMQAVTHDTSGTSILLETMTLSGKVSNRVLWSDVPAEMTHLQINLLDVLIFGGVVKVNLNIVPDSLVFLSNLRDALGSKTKHPKQKWTPEQIRRQMKQKSFVSNSLIWLKDKGSKLKDMQKRKILGASFSSFAKKVSQLAPTRRLEQSKPPETRYTITGYIQLNVEELVCHITGHAQSQSASEAVVKVHVHDAGISVGQTIPENHKMEEERVVQQGLTSVLLRVADISFTGFKNKKALRAQSSQPIGTLEIHSFVVNFVNYRGENTFFDIVLHFDKCNLSFALSRFSKMNTLVKSWMKLINKMQSANIPATKNTFPNVKAKIDLRNILISTEDNIPFVFQYDLRRVTVIIKPDDPSSLKCTVHFVDHNMSFHAKASDPQSDWNERAFTFPPVKGSARITHKLLNPNEKTSKAFLDFVCQLEISYLQNSITPNLLSSIILFQSTISKQTNKLLNDYLRFAERRGTPVKAPKQLPRSGNFQFAINVRLQGLEIQALSPDVNIVARTGLVDVTVIARAIECGDHEPYSVKLSLQGYSLKLQDPLNDPPKDGKYSRTCTGVTGNISVRSYLPAKSTTRQHSVPSLQSARTFFESLWISIDRTTLTVQAEVVDRITSFWMYYKQEYTKINSTIIDRTQMKRALETVELSAPIKHRNFSVVVKITQTAVLVPFAAQLKSSEVHQHHALLISLDTFTLSGHVNNTNTLSEPSRNIVSKCTFADFCATFIENYNHESLHTYIASPPFINRAMIRGGTCNLCTLIAPKLLKTCIQLNTMGLYLDINATIVQYLIFLKRALFVGQRKWKRESESGERNARQISLANHETEASAANQWVVKMDFTLTTDEFGCCTLHKIGEDGHSQAKSSKLETFPFPPFSFEAAYVFLPSSVHVDRESDKSRKTGWKFRNNGSETTLMLILQSSHIKFSPNLVIFVNEVLEKTRLLAEQAEAQPAVKESPNTLEKLQPYLTGLRTAAIRLHKTAIEFTCNPVTEVVCKVELGPLEVFLSSMLKRNIGNELVLLNNLTLNVAVLGFKFFHPLFPEDSVSWMIESIQGNIGQAYGIRLDHGPVVTLLLHIRKMKSIIWLSNIITSRRQNNSLTLPASSTQSPSFSLRESLTLYVHTIVKKVQANIDLGQSIGKVGISLSRTFFQFGFPGRLQGELVGSMFFMTLMTRAISVLCEGNLSGSATVEAVVIDGEHYFAYENRSVQKPINKWCLQLYPVVMSLAFNMSPVIDCKTGKHPNVSMTVKYKEYIGETNQQQLEGEISSHNLSLKISSETISSFTSIYSRIAENVAEKYSTAAKKFRDASAVHKLSFHNTNAASKPVSTSNHRTGRILLGDVVVKGTNLNLSVFGFSLRDPAWLHFTMETYQLTLAQSIKQTDQVHRQLSIVLGKNQISKMMEKEDTRLKTIQNAEESWIFKIPTSTILMYSIQLAGSNEVEFYYLTEFKDSVVVSLNISLHAYVQETAIQYIKTIQDSTKRGKSGHTLEETPYKRVFKCKKFEFAPTLSFLGDSTPDVQKVFRWLGIKNIDHTIPKGTHVVTDTLEKCLGVFADMSSILEMVDTKL